VDARFGLGRPTGACFELGASWPRARCVSRGQKLSLSCLAGAESCSAQNHLTSLALCADTDIVSIESKEDTRRTTIGPWVISLTGLSAATLALAMFARYLLRDFDVRWALEMSMYGLVAGVILGAALGLIVGVGAAYSRRASADSHLRFVRAWGLFVCATLLAGLVIFSDGRFGIGREPGEIAGAALAVVVLITGVGLAYGRAPLVVSRYLRDSGSQLVELPARSSEGDFDLAIGA